MLVTLIPPNVFQAELDGLTLPLPPKRSLRLGLTKTLAWILDIQIPEQVSVGSEVARSHCICFASQLY
jgi:hypothetical protein